MSNRWWVSGLLGLSVAACAGSAFADPMTHDGFYFRGAAGLGYLHSSLSAPGLQDASLSGLAIGLLLLITYTGLILFGLFLVFLVATQPMPTPISRTAAATPKIPKTLENPRMLSTFQLTHHSLHD